jgi:outer membrane protein assembly factor BamB
MRVGVVVLLLAACGHKSSGTPAAKPVPVPDATAPAAKGLPEGPKPAWVAELTDETSAVVIGPSGAVIVAQPAGVTLVKDGKIAWTHALDGEPQAWLTVLGECVVAAHGPKVSCLAFADGAPRWEATLPVASGADPEDDPPTAAAGSRANDGRVVIAADDGRLFTIDPTCKSAKPCITGVQLPFKDPEPTLHVLGDGRRVLTMATHLVVIDATGKVLQLLETKDDIGDPTIAADGTLVIAHDDTLVRIDLSTCPPPPPLPTDGGALIGSCETVLARVKDLDNFAPTLTPDGKGAVLAVGGELQRTGPAGADPTWRASVGAVSGVVVIGDAAYAVCEADSGDLDDRPPDLSAISVSDGKPRWRTHLPLAKLGSLDTPRLLADGDALVIVAGKQIARVELAAK